MQKSVFILILLLVPLWSQSQTNYEKFKVLFEQKDSTKIKSLLKEWEQSTPNDPELFSAAANFYFTTSRRDIISLEKEQKGAESLHLLDSSGNTAAFLNSSATNDPEKLKLTFRYLNTGIERCPDRLDLRFGKCYILGQLADYQEFSAEIIRTVQYSIRNKNNWLWTENEKLKDPQKFMLSSIQSYLKQIYDTENDNLLGNLMQIGDTTLKYYPDCVEILSTTAVANILTKNYDKAIRYLKHAEELNSKDFIVLNNIAQGYKLKGDKENAIRYYELTAKYGDEQAKQSSENEIAKLKR